MSYFMKYFKYLITCTVIFYQMTEVKGTFKLEAKQISLSNLPSLPRN